MSGSFAQTVFLVIAAGLLMTFDCHAQRVQNLTSKSGTASEAISIDQLLSDIPRLVRESDLRGSLMHRKLSEYTYSLKKIKRTLNERGKATHELVQGFEAYPVMGQHVLIQLTENGVALPGRRVAEERRRAGEALEQAEQNALKRNTDDDATISARHLQAGVFGNPGGKPSNILIDLSEMLRSCEFSSPRRDRIGTREAIALDFRPRAGVTHPVNLAFINRLHGTIWIDVADRVVTRLEGWPLPPPLLAQNRVATQAREETPKLTEAALVYQQMRLSAGVWVPSLIRMNAGGDTTLFNGLNWDVMFEFSDYKRYSTDVGDIKLERPKEQP